jgi:hypothetical protein
LSELPGWAFLSVLEVVSGSGSVLEVEVVSWSVSVLELVSG